MAILDGPVDLGHPALAGASLRTEELLVPASRHRGTASRHGTHVASVIFGHHGGAVPGLAPGCRGIILPIFGSGPDDELMPCSQVDLALAIARAVDLGAQVINVSGGQRSSSPQADLLLARAVDLCRRERVLLVAAAGNDGCDCLHLPAALEPALAVGAMDARGRPLPFSNWGEAYARQGLLAPGEEVLGALPSGGDSLRSGTSYASAVVAGVAALLLSRELGRARTADPLAVRRALLEAARRDHSAPLDRRLLAGRLDVAGAAALLDAVARGPEIHASAARRSPASRSTASRQGGDMEIHDSVESEGLPQPETGPPEPAPLEVSQPVTPPPPPRARPPAPSSDLAVVAPDNLAAVDGPGDAPAPDCNEPPVDDRVTAADCGCGGGRRDPPTRCDCVGSGVRRGRPLVYALGQLAHDFPTDARRDSFVQQGLAEPDDPRALLAHLDTHPEQASAVTWVLRQEVTAIYAVEPDGPFAAAGYERLRELYHSQIDEGTEQVSVPGRLGGAVTLADGQRVPAIVPEVRGLHAWSTAALVAEVLGDGAGERAEPEPLEEMASEVTSFLDRVYYELRNLGLAPADRAVNFAATNAFQVERVFRDALRSRLRLQSIDTERSPLCRPESDCWDVRIVFFDPVRRHERARQVYRFTVDVSDVVPVAVGRVRHWPVY